MKTLVLRKRRWARGGRNGGSCLSALLNESRKMCCLGFLGKACGATDEQIDGAPMPSDTSAVCWPRGLICGGRDSKLSDQIASANDSPETTDREREEKLRPLFRKLGYRLVVKP